MNIHASFTGAFSGKTVILTGAASGMGRSMARLLAISGATVHALDVNANGLESLAAENPGPGVVHPTILEVSDPVAYQTVIDDIQRLSKSIDYLFNNAGVTQLGEAQNIPFERCKWLLDINLMGVVYGTQLVYPIMIGQGRGHIICTASIAGATGYATAAAYTASKAAILEFVRSLRAEAKGYGVLVSVACPGYVDSGIFSEDRIVGASRQDVLGDLPVKMMSSDVAAYHLLKGVAKRKNSIIFPFSARVLWECAKWAPSWITPFQRRFLKVFNQG
jgi:NADP-dependent 3-hydroxy acid dehydrogenase YdfG